MLAGARTVEEAFARTNVHGRKSCSRWQSLFWFTGHRKVEGKIDYFLSQFAYKQVVKN